MTVLEHWRARRADRLQCAFRQGVLAYGGDAAALGDARDALACGGSDICRRPAGDDARRRPPGRGGHRTEQRRRPCATRALCEAVPEKLELKRSIYPDSARLAREAPVFATNSSTLLPSALADATGRPEVPGVTHLLIHIWRHRYSG
ncbi:3-hydroxyacyl-CoA dehydrogenase NAD-binding domain-containing protein [Enterobacter kobei]|uniref:3-hydroxyacyl-CoA dehydrogenase NAD-binding domain-containing protein n=1 Tax=Enterobacter kobei TaxID=208224 RepID=UPI003D066730